MLGKVSVNAKKLVGNDLHLPLFTMLKVYVYTLTLPTLVWTLNSPWRIEPLNDMSSRRRTFAKFWHEIFATQRILQIFKKVTQICQIDFYFQKSQITRFYNKFQEVAKNIERSFFFLAFFTFIFGLSQIWLKYLLDGHHFGYITKFKPNKERKIHETRYLLSSSKFVDVYGMNEWMNEWIIYLFVVTKFRSTFKFYMLGGS
jgi:hypothetical protein